jgi:hypothetical protein
MFRSFSSKTIFASDVRKDILKGLDGTNDQIYFDGIKQLLNTLDYSNLQIELIGKEYPKGHRRGAEFEKSRSLTSFYDNSIEVRNEIYNIMKLGGLKNNYPKNGFLCPYELEDVHEEDITADKQVKPQEPAKAIISKTDALNEVNNGVNTCKYKCTEKLPLIKIYKYLIDTDTSLHHNFKIKIMEEITDFLKNLLQPIIKDAVSEAMAANVPQVVDEDKRYTRQQLCDRWAITLPTLNTYVNDGKVTPIRLGRRVLFAESEILRAESAGVCKYRHNNK